ncbi:MAG TPA: ABC transporter permease [Bryobacteraceae bacterium]|nr:ABC transporter permease [Bryobacteraceae bacterium]
MRTPWLTLALLLTIALGTGSNVTVYSFARGLTKGPAGSDSPLTSLPGMVSLFEQDAHREAGPLSYQEYLSLKRHLNPFEWMGAVRVLPGSVAMADQSAIVSIASVPSNLAGVLRLPKGKGVVISHRMWQTEFGAKSNIRGDSIRVNGINARVSGVAPEWLEGLYRDRVIDLWTPSQEKPLRGADRSSRNLWVLARLRHNVSIGQAQSTVRSGLDASGEIIVRPYTGMTPEVADGISRISTLFGLAASAVFFIACANVISFLLGRTAARSHETSVRVALGASRRQLARELLGDNVVISVAGGALGLLLAVWTARIVPALLFDQDAERLVFAPSLFSIVAACAACAGITILCGLLPVFASASDRPETVLRRESAGPSRRMRRVRVGLVVSQMASCCVLVISTAFLFDGLRAALQTRSSHRLGDPVLVTVQKQPGPDNGLKYYQQVEQATRSLPGISGMAWAGRLPGNQPAWQSFRVEPRNLPLREITMDSAWFTGDSLKLFKLPPRDGRLFGFGDQGCRVAIVNETAAAELFDSNTVGRTIQDSLGPPVEIIGVVAQRVRDAATSSRPTIYYNHSDQAGPAPDRIVLAHFRAPIRSELVSAELDANVVSQRYFPVMGLSLVAGDEFADHSIPGECRVGVVNQEAADLYFGGKPVGAAVIDDRGVRTAIIGVVRSRPFGTFQRQSEPAIYFPMFQDSLSRMTLIAGMRHIDQPLLADLQRRIESVPGRGPAPVVVQTLATHLTRTALAPLRIATTIIGASAATALMLSILGLFGALSDAARQRRRELAIRIALGAQRWRIVYQVLREGGRLACVGTLMGMFGSLALSRLLSRITSAQSLPALWVWLAAPAVLTLALLIASVLPARRSLLVSPLTVMREDN